MCYHNCSTFYLVYAVLRAYPSNPIVLQQTVLTGNWRRYCQRKSRKKLNRLHNVRATPEEVIATCRANHSVNRWHQYQHGGRAVGLSSCRAGFTTHSGWVEDYERHAIPEWIRFLCALIEHKKTTSEVCYICVHHSLTSYVWMSVSIMF